MKYGLLALLIWGGAAAPATSQVAVPPPETNDGIVSPGVPSTWIPDRREPDSMTAIVPDPRPPTPPASVFVPRARPEPAPKPPNTPSDAGVDPDAPPAPTGPVCAPKGARQSPEHSEVFHLAMRLLFDDDIPGAIAALQASLDAAANWTEQSLSLQVLADIHEADGNAAEAAKARQTIAELGCLPPD
jgi:hypothetical protein